MAVTLRTRTSSPPRSPSASDFFLRLSLALLLGLSPLARGGTIRGTLRAEGKQGADADAEGGAYASKRLKFAQRVDYSSLRDFVVYLDHSFSEKPVPPAAPVQIVVQKDAVFDPHVLAVVVGTTVEWPNRDDIYHNVFSFSDPKSFDLGLYKDETKRVTFEQAGRVDIFCSIHSAMHCIILVLDNPYYAVLGEQGSFEIRDVPAGTYRLKAWHERLPPQILNVTVPATGSVDVDIVMGITGLPQL